MKSISRRFRGALGHRLTRRPPQFSFRVRRRSSIQALGTVTRVEWFNPHTWFYIDVREIKDDAGKVMNMGMEMGSPNALMRAGWTRDAMKIGEKSSSRDSTRTRDKADRKCQGRGLREDGTTVLCRVECRDSSGGECQLLNSTSLTCECLLLFCSGVPLARAVDDYQTKGIPEPRTESRTCWRHSPEQPMAGRTSPVSGRRRAEPTGKPEGLKELSVLVISSTSFEIQGRAHPAIGGEIYKERRDNLLRDNPLIRCLPAGVPRLDAYTHPYKIIQTPGPRRHPLRIPDDVPSDLLDGRAHPEDPQPSWMGYSVGKWDGDVLVVETDRVQRQDVARRLGHPHSEKMHLTERFKRRDLGHMDIEIIIDDPKAYTNTIDTSSLRCCWSTSGSIKYICNENAKPVG